MWRSFELDKFALRHLSHPGAMLRLEDSGQLSAVGKIEMSIEKSLMDWIRELRRENSLQTFFDEKLGNILHPTLASYGTDLVCICVYARVRLQMLLIICYVINLFFCRA